MNIRHSIVTYCVIPCQTFLYVSSFQKCSWTKAGVYTGELMHTRNHILVGGRMCHFPL